MNKTIKRFALAFITTITILSTLLIISNYDEKYTNYESYIVQQGDTLWNIAREYQREGDIRRLVYEISKINDTKAHELKEGQELFIPTR